MDLLPDAQRPLGGPEKVAALLLAMGKPAASRVLKHFDEGEIRQIARAVSELGAVPKSVVEELIEEFTQGVAAGQDLSGGVAGVEDLLSDVVSGDQLTEILSVVRGDASKLVWPRVARLPDTVLAQYLRREHPQVAAFILSRLETELAAAVIAKLPADVRNAMVRRMVAIKPVSEIPLRLAEEKIQSELLQKGAKSSGSQTQARLADIINRLDRPQMDDILSNLSQHRPKDARRVRKLIFTFEDIAVLSQSHRAKLVDQIPPERVTTALRGADPTLQNLVLSCLSGRSRRMIEQELQSGAEVAQKDIVAARRAITSLAQELSARGEIELGPQEPEDAE